MPKSGPSLRSWGIPGMRRNSRAPSSTISVYGSGLSRADVPNPWDAAFLRSSSASSSWTRRPMASGSEPTSERQFWPAWGVVWGSQCTQVQTFWASGDEESTTSARSRGLCRIAACATSQFATPRAEPRSPATPTTPSSASGSTAGTSARTGGCTDSSRAPPLAARSSTSEGRAASPARSCSTSGSTIRRSQSRRRGPVAHRSNSAGSGWASRRSRCSCLPSSVSLTAYSARSVLYCLTARLCRLRSWRASPAQ